MVSQNDNTNENIESLKNAIHNVASTSKHSFKNAHEDNKETFTRAKSILKMSLMKIVLIPKRL